MARKTTKKSRPWRAGLLVTTTITALLAATGCGAASDKTGGTDKAGGSVSAAPTQLHWANTRGDEAQPFLDRLAEVSGGALNLAGEHQYEQGELRAEVDALHAVQSGQVDVALVPIRAYDFIGVKSFDALMSPMLIDNVALEQQVLSDPVATDMLNGVSSAGLTGIGVVPGPIRVPNGISRRLLGPSSYAGAKIAYSPAAVADQGLRALGADPIESAFEGADISGFDGLEAQPAAISGNMYDEDVRWITGNVGLWPRPNAIVANKDSWAKLTAEQQGWLLDAAKTAIPGAAELASDTESIANMCRRKRVAFISATDGDIAKLRTAFAPVQTWLRTDSTTAGYLDRIQAIKTRAGAEMSSQGIDCATLLRTPSGTTAKATTLDGNYLQSTNEKELAAAGAPSEDLRPENWGEWKLVLDHNHFAFTQHNAQACTWGYGTFTINNGTIELAFTDGGGKAPTNAKNDPGELFDYAVSTYHDSMKWSSVEGAVSPEQWLSKPWQRKAVMPSTGFLEKSCLPPAGWNG